MNVRLATVKDVSGVKKLLTQLVADGFDSTTFDGAFQSIVDSPDKAIIVIDVAGVIAGAAVINLVQKLSSCEARIDEVIVDSQYRGQGYGAALMKACDKWAYDNGADVIEFTSRPSRVAANALYQKLGYTQRDTNVYQRKKAD